MIIYLRLIFTFLLAILACKYCIGYFHNVQVYSKNYFNKNYVKVISIFDLIGDNSRKQWYKISKQNNNNNNNNNFSLNRNKKKISEDIIHSSSSSNNNIIYNNNNDRKRHIISNNQENDYLSSNYTTSPLQPFEEIQPDKNCKKSPLFLARLLSWMLKRIVMTKTEDIRGLDMNVLATSNRNVMRGQFDTIEMKFDKIAYQNFFVSGGGKLIIKGTYDTAIYIYIYIYVHSITINYDDYVLVSLP